MTFVILALAEPVLRPDLKLTSGIRAAACRARQRLGRGARFQPARRRRQDGDRRGRPRRPSSLLRRHRRAARRKPRRGDARKRRRAASPPSAPRPYLPNRRALADRLKTAFAPSSVEAYGLPARSTAARAPAFAAALNGIAGGGAMLQSARPLTVMRPPQNRSRRRLRADQPLWRRRDARMSPASTRKAAASWRVRRRSTRDGDGRRRDRAAGRNPERAGPLRRDRRIERRRRAASRRPLAAEVGRPRSPAKARPRRSRCLSRSPMSSARSRRPPIFSPPTPPSTSDGGEGADQARRIDHRADGDRHAAARHEPGAC